MNFYILSSTLLLTVLSLVGLVFFIRASTKARIQQITLVSEQPEASLMAGLQQYMQQRAYKVAKVDAENNSVTFEGFVRPSVFLAVFLTMLAAVGILCLLLVLSQLIPNWSWISLNLVLLSPVAGVFYWKKAGRNEQVSLKLDNSGGEQQSKITVVAHRDELIELQRSLALKSAE